MKNKAYLILFAALIFTSNLSMGQKLEKPTEWKQFKEVSGVLIYYKFQEHHSEKDGLHQELLLLKMVNTTSSNLKIQWDIELWYDDKCTTCGKNMYNENHKEFVLKESDSVEGNSDVESNWDLKIFSKFLNHKNIPELTKFELTKLIVEPL
ncbi:MAG: hypothetical protein K9J13_05150 [Saprospiraceae bacterium]|nr:hypothetical protein [Saprospiraceae bacterium]